MSAAERKLHTICDIFERRWSAQILAELHALHGAKFVTLTHRLGASPTVVRATLDRLMQREWVRHNPGHGHPLRPEYVLTTRGARLAPACAAIDVELRRIGLASSELRRWSLPVVYLAGRRMQRFADFAGGLVGVTDRALSLTLKDLCGWAMLARSVVASYPPMSVYELTDRARALSPILADIA